MTCFSIPLHVPVLPQQIEPPAKPDTLQESSTIINRLWSTRVPEKKYWLQDPIFRDLCDLVASSRIICMTGAGISSALKCRHIPGHLLTWPKLLEQLYHEFHDQLDPEVRSDIQQLIRGNSTGDELIEAASLLRAALRKSLRANTFDNAFRKYITPVPNATTPVHESIIKIYPRGIITFNYDCAQEVAIGEEISKWNILLPNSYSKFVRAIKTIDTHPFLLKAHGSLNSSFPLIFTYESYRELFIKYPEYRMFVQFLLTNYNLLIIGFGLNDPDFDLFLNTIVSQFGSTLHKHIAIRHKKEKSPRDIILRRRYGIHMLYVKEYTDIPHIVEDTIHETGPELDIVLRRCLSQKREERTRAHHELQNYGFVGKKRASAVIRKELRKRNVSKDIFEISELIYALGKLNPYEQENKKVLIDIINRSHHAYTVANALAVLRESLVPEDVPQLLQWYQRFSQTRLHSDKKYPDPDNRLPTYVLYLIKYVRAKFNAYEPLPDIGS
ncbi:MAG: SIR2 family NAD-dependent protein deacylase [bacterium]|jgi:hypothetical protein